MKHEVKNSRELKQAISDLEQKLNVQEVKMKDQYEHIRENLQPKNLLKNTYSHVAETPELQRTLVNTVIGFIMGYAFKKAHEVLNEETLDTVAKNMINATLTKLEQGNRQSILAKGVTMLRKTTPATSSLYEYVRYR